jgi:hypothetical protein
MLEFLGMALRFDSWRLDASKITRLASGAIRVPAALSRVGVLTYYMGGRVIKEYRPEEEVTRADSIASLRDAPVTIGHPRERLVSPSNWPIGRNSPLVMCQVRPR